MGIGKDNDQAPAGQRDGAGSGTAQEAQRSWVTVLASDANQVAVGVATTAAIYGAKVVVDKIRKPPPPPPGSASDSEA